MKDRKGKINDFSGVTRVGSPWAAKLRDDFVLKRKRSLLFKLSLLNAR